jgi:hypothetical protein
MSDGRISPCPQGLEQREFDVDANPPDPEAADIADRKQSVVKAA